MIVTRLLPSITIEHNFILLHTASVEVDYHNKAYICRKK